MAARRWPGRFGVRQLELAANSFGLAAAAALLIAVLALVVAYGVRLRPNPLMRASARVAGMGYAIPGAVIAIETPNPACLAIFATHFYIDPTHTRPVPPVLLRFYMEEAGFSGVEIEYLSPAVESMPAIGDLPKSVQDAFFGGLDYAIFATKL